MTATPSTKRESMIPVVDALLAATTALHRALTAAGAEHGLTAQQALLLRMLDEPVSMSVFASELACDPSNVTGLVDRLERLGLVARQPSAEDRRIRLLSLTRKGRTVRDRLGHDLGVSLDDQWQLTGGEIDHMLQALQRINQPLAP